MESKKSRVEDLQRRIANSPGHRIYQQRKAIEISFQIYEGNFQDICSVLNYMDDVSVAVKILAQGNELQREKIDLELRRKLFNCLSAAFALIDHTRKFMAGYGGDLTFVNEYKKRIDEDFANFELHRFFQDYRNYVHHYTVPLITHTLHFGRDVGEKYTCGMTKKRLLKWGGWSKLARSWISKQPDIIPIEDNIKAHHQNVAQLYEWFLDEIMLIHEQDFEETNELIRQHNTLLESPSY